MIRSAMLWAAVVFAGFGQASAETFPLAFKTVNSEAINTFPGGYGIYSQIRVAKPAGLKAEPKPVSRRPLYGQFSENSDGPQYVFRLDESKGTGKGYDQIIVDMNRNGDLTDDQAAPAVTKPTDKQTGTRAARPPVWFGPITAAADKVFAGGRPAYFAQARIINLPEALAGGDLRNFSAGYIYLKSAWYLEATAKVNGLEQKIAVYDANANLRLGEAPESQTYNSGEEKNWYFRPGDNFLVDADNSGSYETDPLQSELRPFGPMLYLGGALCKVSLDAGFTSLRVEPWTDPLAEVALEPKGGEVRVLTLAWEHPAGKWQLVSAPAEGGKIKVPPGKYRLYACTLLGKSGSPDQVMVSGSQRALKTPVKFEAGKANALKCGGPLQIKATAEKRKPQSYELPREAADPKQDSDYIVRLNANMLGADGEIYSTFLKGAKLNGEPAKPVFAVLDSSGKQLAKGNLEFG